ncbi:MAG: hypothetical protein J6P17_03010, partial [Acidaminococcaceae bacterium]|nr:hypothetical protein [Acidaminococcaceae bacterium]
KPGEPATAGGTVWILPAAAGTAKNDNPAQRPAASKEANSYFFIINQPFLFSFYLILRNDTER